MIFVTVLGSNSGRQVQWFTIGASLSFKVSVMVSGLSTLVSYVTITLTWCFPFRTVFRSFETLLASYQRFDIARGYEKDVKRRIMVHLIFGNFLLAMYTLSVLLNHGSEMLEIQVYFSYVVILTFIYVTDVQFIAFVLILNKNFSGINLQLIGFHNYQVETRRNGSKNASTSGIKLSSGGMNFSVRVLASFHDELCKIADKLNSAYSTHIIVHLVGIFCNLCFNSYHCFIIIFQQEYVRKTDILLPLVAFCHDFMQMLQLVYYCAGTSYQVRFILNHLFVNKRSQVASCP